MRKAVLFVLLALCTRALHAQLPPECQAGVEALVKEDFASAVPAFSRCLDLQISDETRARMLRQRAEALDQLSRAQEAVEDQKRSLLLAEPEDVWPLITLARFHRKLKQYDEALVALEKAKHYDEDGPGTGPGMAVGFHTGLTFKEMGQTQKAIEAFTAAVPKQPEYSSVYYQRGLCYEALGDRVHAKEDLVRAYGLNYPSGRDPAFLAKLAEYGFSPKPNSHEQAVEELFQLMDFKRTVIGGVTIKLNAQIPNDPAIVPYREVIAGWGARVMTWESLGPPLIKIYVEAFSESELREMIAFYRTPTGRKVLTNLPVLMKKGEAIGVELAKAHQAELEEALLIRKQRLEAENKP